MADLCGAVGWDSEARELRTTEGQTLWLTRDYCSTYSGLEKGGKRVARSSLDRIGRRNLYSGLILEHLRVRRCCGPEPEGKLALRTEKFEVA